MPQPVAIAMRLSEQQKRLLEGITRARTNQYRLVQRAQLVLWADQGMTNTEIASPLGQVQSGGQTEPRKEKGISS
jgi:hypothetical protein